MNTTPSTCPGCTAKNQTQNSTYNGTVPPTPLPFADSDSCEPTWAEFYNDALEYESGNEPQLKYFNTIGSYSPLPNVMKYTMQQFPQFDLGIPDQYRVDVWQQDFNHDVAAGKVPQLSFIWVMSDHTTGPPNATAEQADNGPGSRTHHRCHQPQQGVEGLGDLYRRGRRTERR